ncbi:MAG: SDR family oxidoreductase [bacterium]|nr:SDR family oxidoreductase [bacterium]
MARLESRVAIVIGGGQFPGEDLGNGRAMSLLFAREGAAVVVADKNVASAEETCGMICEEGGQAFAVEADVSREADCKEVLERCIDTHGRVDVLVNNVGIMGPDDCVEALSEDAWDRIFDVNLKSVFFACKYAIPLMAERNRGSIINISSLAAIAPAAGAASKVSKAGVNALTQQMAMSVAAKGIRVNAIMPGRMRTARAIEGIKLVTGEDRDRIIEDRAARTPLAGGVGDATDIANAALFFACDESRFVTSVMMPVDGGQSSLIG